MELLCTKCRRLFEYETNTCPFCGSTETRLPQPDDNCLLSDTEIYAASGIAEMLNQKGIPFLL